MGDLSPHFSAREFRCHCGCGKQGPVSIELLAVLERIRGLTGRPLRIVSGVRCESHNGSVGGARRSRHLFGDAADIGPGRVSPAEAHRLGAVGVGIRDGWAVHVDTRPGRQARWYY